MFAAAGRWCRLRDWPGRAEGRGQLTSQMTSLRFAGAFLVSPLQLSQWQAPICLKCEIPAILFVSTSFAPFASTFLNASFASLLLCEPTASVTRVTFLPLCRSPSVVAFTAPSAAEPMTMNSLARSSLRRRSMRGSSKGSEHLLWRIT